MRVKKAKQPEAPRDVFEADDQFLGHVTVPFNMSIYGADGVLVWGAQSGDSREDYVVVWRMERGP